MKPGDRYVNEVLRHVFAAPQERQRLAADLRAHFAAAEERGEPANRIAEALGTPAEVAAAFNAEREFRFAGFWQRLVAFIGDFGLLVVLAAPAIGLAVYLSSRGVELGAGAIGWTVALAMLVVGAVGVAIFYFPLLEWRFGKTLGKHLVRVRVVRESGAPIGLGQAFVRRLSLYFEMLIVDALFIPFTDRRQRALDVIAKTVVAREPGEEAPAWGYAVCLLLPAAATGALAAVALLCAP